MSSGRMVMGRVYEGSSGRRPQLAWIWVLMVGQRGSFRSNIAWFLAVQISQHIRRGIFLSLTLCFSSESSQASIMDLPCHWCRVGEDEEMRVHCSMIIGQNKNKWSMSSSLFLQRWHQNGPWKDHLIKFEPVGILLKRMVHISIRVLGAALSFHSAFH